MIPWVSLHDLWVSTTFVSCAVNERSHGVSVTPPVCSRRLEPPKMDRKPCVCWVGISGPVWKVFIFALFLRMMPNALVLPEGRL